MFDELRASAPLRAIYWKDLVPGLAFAGGLSINGAPPAELNGYPVLSPGLISDLHGRYKLSPTKKLLVYAGDGGLSPSEFSAALLKARARLAPLNAFRSGLRTLKAAQPAPDLAVWDSAWVEKGTLIWPLRSAAPSLLVDLARDLGMAEVLNREVFTRFRFPPDSPCALHLVVDQSYSMKASGKDALVQGAASIFRGRLAALLPKADITLYAFSSECRVVSGVLSGKEVRREGTDFASFVPPVLRRLKAGVPNAVMLFTDGLPDERRGALRALERLERAGADYTQIIFNLKGDRKSFALVDGAAPGLDGYLREGEEAGGLELTEEEYRAQEEVFRRGFAELARAAGGRQLVITADEALSLAAVEAFDRWYGGLGN